jgi:hypothetical protein
MSGFDWSIVSVQITVGDLKRKQKQGAVVSNDNRRRRRHRHHKKTKISIVPPSPTVAVKKSRHMNWSAGATYVLIRNGTVITEDAIDALYDKNELNESLFFLFKHHDPDQNRNENIPLYEAAFLCAPPNTANPHEDWKRHNNVVHGRKLPVNYRYIRVQKRHLEQAYPNSERKDKTRMWDVDEDTGCPYYVDRYAFRVQNERVVKQRHENKKRVMRKEKAQKTGEGGGD